jgi:integrase
VLARLFPDLSLAKNTVRYSHVFSKWFGRFLIAACGYRPKATFNSFRHHFRTSLMNAGVPTELAEALGGWKSDSSSEYEYRHRQLPTLRAAVEKVV